MKFDRATRLFVLAGMIAALAGATPKPDRLAITGDSIGMRWPANLLQGLPLDYVNRGVGSARSTATVKSFDLDVLYSNSDRVLIIVGINDLTDHKDSKEVIDNYKLYIDECRKSGIRLYIATIVPAFGPAPEREVVNAWVKKGGDFVPVDFAAVLRARDGGPNMRYFESDRCHPNRKGYKRMRRVLIRALRQKLKPL